jgi:hypothetical protein
MPKLQVPILLRVQNVRKPVLYLILLPLRTKEGGGGTEFFLTLVSYNILLAIYCITIANTYLITRHNLQNVKSTFYFNPCDNMR